VALEVGDSILPMGRTDLCRTGLGNEAQLVGRTKSAGRCSTVKSGQSERRGINSEIKSWCWMVVREEDARNFASMRFRYRPVVCIAELDEHWDVPRMTRS
jgi:hypothetical protein